MKSKSLVLLAVAAGCGLVAMLGVQQMLSGGRQPVQAKTRILVAKTDIDPGIALDKSNVSFKEWPKDAVPEGAITKEEEYAERALKHHVGPGQPIVVAAMGNKGDFGISAQIPEGMTVVTYPATATMTHSGLLQPGAYVNVSAAIESPQKGGGKRTEVKPVLQCVQVIAVGNQTAGTETASDANPKEAKNVSFLVFPLQGQILQLAYKKSNGSIQLALRGKTDKTNANVSDLSEEQMSSLSNKLFGEPEENKPVSDEVETVTAAKPKPAIKSFVKSQTSSAITSVGDQPMRRTWKIDVFQGDKRETQEIDWPEEVDSHAPPTSIDTRRRVGKSPLEILFGNNPGRKSILRRPTIQRREFPQTKTIIPSSDPLSSRSDRPTGVKCKDVRRTQFNPCQRGSILPTVLLYGFAHCGRCKVLS